MATVPSHEYREARAHEGHVMGFAIGESAAEAVCGAATIVLAIIGLANPEWTILTPIAAILAGGALVFAGIAVCTRCMSAVGPADREVEASMSAEFLGGIAGIVLGVLAILGLVPNILISAAVIVFGGSMLLGSVATSGFRSWTSSAQAGAEGTSVTHYGVRVATGSQVLFGLGTTILGIIALVGESHFGPTLNLVSLLVVGAGVLLTGTALTGRMMSSFTR